MAFTQQIKRCLSAPRFFPHSSAPPLENDRERVPSGNPFPLPEGAMIYFPSISAATRSQNGSHDTSDPYVRSIFRIDSSLCGSLNNLPPTRFDNASHWFSVITSLVSILSCLTPFKKYYFARYVCMPFSAPIHLSGNIYWAGHSPRAVARLTWPLPRRLWRRVTAL
jgi:hypothetical protein